MTSDELDLEAIEAELHPDVYGDLDDATLLGAGDARAIATVLYRALRAARQRIAALEGELAERVRLCEVCDAPIYIGGFCVISPSDGWSLHCCSESCLAIAAGRVRLAMALGDAATPAAREGEG